MCYGVRSAKSYPYSGFLLHSKIENQSIYTAKPINREQNARKKPLPLRVSSNSCIYPPIDSSSNNSETKESSISVFSSVMRCTVVDPSSAASGLMVLPSSSSTALMLVVLASPMTLTNALSSLVNAFRDGASLATFKSMASTTSSCAVCSFSESELGDM